MDSNRDFARRIEALENRYDEQFAIVFDAIKRLIAEDDGRKARPRCSIGFLARGNPHRVDQCRADGGVAMGVGGEQIHLRGIADIYINMFLQPGSSSGLQANRCIGSDAFVERDRQSPALLAEHQAICLRGFPVISGVEVVVCRGLGGMFAAGLRRCRQVKKQDKPLLLVIGRHAR